MEEIEPGAPGGLNRRSLIKRAGIVGAGVAAWSTPMVTSLASKAYAVGSATTGCHSCSNDQDPGDSCFGQKQCGTTGPLGACWCGTNFDNQGCTCYQDDFCDNVQSCTVTSECPSGLVCVYTCCPGGRCWVPCDNTAGVRIEQKVTAGARGSGR